MFVFCLVFLQALQVSNGWVHNRQLYQRDHHRLRSSPLFGLQEAAASYTQQTCELLGVKSLGVDYGLVRTGVAVTVGYEPVSIGLITGNNTICMEKTVEQVAEYALHHAANRIVVGWPLHKNGTMAEQTMKTKEFGIELQKEVWCTVGNIPVIFFDERYTSKEAAARQGDSQRALYGTLDVASACIILEEYYRRNGESGHAVDLPDAAKQACLRQFAGLQMEQANERQRLMDEREEKMQRRRESIRAYALEQENAPSSKKKKKKKRKKKR